MVRTSARALVAPLTVAALLTSAACAGKEPAEAPASAAAAPADGEIQLVDAPAASAGLTGDGRGEPAAAASEAAASEATASGAAQPGAAPSAAAAPAAVALEPPAKWVQLSTNEAAIGDTITEVRGFTLYRFTGDSADPSASKCTGDCALRWPPVLIQPGGRVFVDGIKSAKVGAIRRPDGGVQVTVAGWPAYQFSGDTVPGEFNGQGVDNAWFAFKPSGEANKDLIAAVVAEPASPDRTETLTAKKTDDGAIIVDDDGATVYRNDNDSTDPPASKCDDVCATLWQPVVAKTGGKVKLKGIDRDRVWWMSRDDGTKQVTLDGSPLYRNVADKSTGTVIASAAEQGWTPAR
ncbi:hypothetical protein [Mangrovihabitans endophyticus]|uniref:Lipoprotein with Yx(FWY)xxD motif n=1 Tax=Mangrovihabitans endophyticus TaxID=1751298 RepID=A0A8J3BWN4_9ACTN|nr:hypothetical protein [Mangrovihabitans endophyticus]GGK76337.1 hypothetical protein GCM10012284_07830 [Mangrovihabitans endophyticus]